MNVILHKNNHAPRQRNQALLLTAAGAAILAAVPLNAASADEIDAPAVLLADVTPVSDAELAQNRGGFSIGTLDIAVGFSVTTSVQGPNITPISVTTNYSINQPGQLTNLGAQISSQVNTTLAQSGLGGSSNDKPDAPPSPDPGTQQLASNAAVTPPPIPNPSGQGSSDPTTTSIAANNPPPPLVQTPSNPDPNLNTPNNPPAPLAQTPSNPNSTANSNTPNNPPTSLVQNTAPPSPGDNSKSSFTVQADPLTSSINITNNDGAKVGVSTANGILTTVTNSLDNVTVQTQVDLNYAINNYHDVIQNAQAFQQAMNLAQQMLAIRGIAGH